MKRLISIIFFFVFILYGCQKEPAQVIKVSDKETRPSSVPFYSLEIKKTGSRIEALLSGFDPLKNEIEWFVNGRQVLKGSLVFEAEELKRGDTVVARVKTGDIEITSNEIIIPNTPPFITRVKLMPEVLKAGERLYIDASAKDRDDDPVEIFYDWYINGERAGSGKEIPVPVKRGDRITVKITPYDGTNYGNTVTLYREILNMPPEIKSSSEWKVDNGIFQLRLHTSDPDGDPLTYSLKEAPDGMTIDEKGLIKWNIPPDFKGKAPVTVSVTDGHGGEALYSFEVNIGIEGR